MRVNIISVTYHIVENINTETWYCDQKSKNIAEVSKSAPQMNALLLETLKKDIY